MLKRILIANRGEIAVRIIRACREMNVETVAVYSLADKNSLHVKLATFSVCIGKNEPSDSYLNMQNIITAAIALDCDAIHPAFGFLSENPNFADIVEKCGLKFIGPSSEVIRTMGNKAAAKALAMKSGVPVIKGSDGIVDTIEDAYKISKTLGYPVIVKASAGGGGRGMRIANSESELENAFFSAKSEAMSGFGDDSVYIERFIRSPKHIEVQILADDFGNVVHLGERECSVQRRNQKLIEESPSKSITPEQRAKMGAAAVSLAQNAGYTNAGTIEYVVDEKGDFYFIEMNTRIQVEHGVTETVTGIDIVKQQILIASGEPLHFTQDEIKLTGSAIECRINAENPQMNFIPSAGKVSFVHFPGGYNVRVDSALFSGGEISPYYDSMVAKIIVKGETREEAITRMRRALDEFSVEGIVTNQAYLYLILHHKDFVKGDYNTSFVEKYHNDLLRELNSQNE